MYNQEAINTPWIKKELPIWKTVVVDQVEIDLVKVTLSDIGLQWKYSYRSSKYLWHDKTSSSDVACRGYELGLLYVRIEVLHALKKEVGEMDVHNTEFILGAYQQSFISKNEATGGFDVDMLHMIGSLHDACPTTGYVFMS